MTTTATSQPPAAQPAAARGRNRHRGPPRRGGRGGAQQNGGTSTDTQVRDPTSNLGPASAPPGAQQPGAPPARDGGPSNSSRGRGRNRGGRNIRGGGGGRGGNLGQPIPGGGGRRFGGQLTTAALESEAGVPAGAPQIGLQGDAPVFRPGQPVAARNPPVRPQFRARRMSKSQAPDLASRIHEDISNGLYECAICSDEITRKSKIWSCKTCWTVFHIHCVKKWAKNEGSTQARAEAQNGDMPPARQWRCPGCNLPKDDLPTTYSCWCGKETEPRNIPGIPPHSCAQSCGRERLTPKPCPHPCDLLCHSGPCPPCRANGLEQSCFCGGKSRSKRCLDTDYENGWSCGDPCGDPMPNCDHICDRPCHEGLCGSCNVEVESKCYCGKTEKAMKCYDTAEEKMSMGENGDWIGSHECGLPCERKFDCNFHACRRSICHPQDLHPAHCPFSPDSVSHCPCGKTALTSLLEEPRTSCLDAVPRCAKICEKNLPCGHLCQQRCHTDECAPCLQKTEIKCRCGRIGSVTVCHQGNVEPPQCSRVCRVTLNCGRHECGDRCCQGEKRAAERQATKRKLRPLGASGVIDEGFEAEHICTRVCGRPLKCGSHSCGNLCHKGPCLSCREAIFDEISCNCGRTVLHPPLPCGTPIPPCRHPCRRPTSCGHPAIAHSCHTDEEKCPPCPFLVEKKCVCGKKLLKNQACFFRDVRCGEPCDKKLKCGTHRCQLTCHRPGEREDSGKECAQVCSRPKRYCQHLDNAPCHAPYPCNEEKPCDGILVVTCECQNRKTSVKCLATRSNPGNQREKLPCSDECARLLRNQQLAKALNIDPATHTDDHVPYSRDTLQMFRDNPKYQAQEREIRVFAADDREKRLRFPPMKASQRAFLHSLAADFGLDSESMDPEPHRHVVYFKTPKFVSSPLKTLVQCVRVKPAVEPSPAMSKKLASNADPFNALVLNNPRFALTTDEIQADFARDFASVSGTLKFDIFFLPSDQVLLKPTPTSPSTTPTSTENALHSLKPSISRTIFSKKLAANVSLCRVDSSLNILRREDEAGAAAGGWSQVAAKGAAGPSKAKGPEAVGAKSAFTVLGNLAKKKEKARAEEEERKRREKEIEEAPESWEDAAGDGEGDGDGNGDGVVSSPDESVLKVGLESAPATENGDVVNA